MPKFSFPKLSRRSILVLILTLACFFLSLAWIIDDLRYYEPIISSITQIMAVMALLEKPQS